LIRSRLYASWRAYGHSSPVLKSGRASWRWNATQSHSMLARLRDSAAWASRTTGRGKGRREPVSQLGGCDSVAWWPVRGHARGGAEESRRSARGALAPGHRLEGNRGTRTLSATEAHSSSVRQGGLREGWRRDCGGRIAASALVPPYQRVRNATESHSGLATRGKRAGAEVFGLPGLRGGLERRSQEAKWWVRDATESRSISPSQAELLAVGSWGSVMMGRDGRERTEHADATQLRSVVTPS